MTVDPAHCSPSAPLTPARTGREFPYLGATNLRATPATRAPFFVTGPFVRAVNEAGGSPRIAGGPFHAKQMGTMVTVCGLIAYSWTKVWDVPFSPSLTPVCLDCAAVARNVAGQDNRVD